LNQPLYCKDVPALIPCNQFFFTGLFT